MSEFKKGLLSTIKWMWLIAFAAIAFYKVVPKYEKLQWGNDNRDYHLLNKVTGNIKLGCDTNCER